MATATQGDHAPPESWGLERACPQCGHTAPREGAARGASVRHALMELATGDAASRQAWRVGTLARLVAYLKDNGILESLEADRGYHRLHKYAYIAQGMGARLGYEFDFLETGASSVRLEVDISGTGAAKGGTEPFGGDARASGRFLGLVRGKGTKWLQLATFAVRERGREGALEDFMAAPQGIIKYDAETAKSAFGEVEERMRAEAP